VFALINPTALLHLMHPRATILAETHLPQCSRLEFPSAQVHATQQVGSWLRWRRKEIAGCGAVVHGGARELKFEHDARTNSNQKKARVNKWGSHLKDRLGS
jgi:putative component of membrane protein insertase Oxa1/YidC/SpoIIIJ protein YidD